MRGDCPARPAAPAGAGEQGTTRRGRFFTESEVGCGYSKGANDGYRLFWPAYPDSESKDPLLRAVRPVDGSAAPLEARLSPHFPATQQIMRQRLWSFVKENPIPPFALLGLIAGTVLTFWVHPQHITELITGGSFAFGWQDLDIADWVWLVTLVVGGAPLVWSTLKGMLRGRFASDVVAMLAILTAVVMGEYFAGVIVVLMQSGGEALERYGLRRASSSLEHLLARAPRTARRKQADRLEEIDVAEVAIGDHLVVRPGELIPVDGTLLSPSADVDESAVTGEPLAAGKQRDDRLLSGSVNAGGPFEMQATALSSQSQYARIVALVRQAQDEKPPIGRLADQYAVWFTPLTLLMCALGWFITGDPRTILAVLVVATPCPLILATPIAVISGINRAADRGIIVKGGAAIEQVGRAKAVVFDKTGTLTLGTPVLDRVTLFNGHSAAGLLRKAASVEQLSSHLLGRTMVQAAQAGGASLLLPVNFQEVPGRGVEGHVEGEHILVGSPRFLAERLGAEQVERVTALREQAAAGDTLAAFVAVDLEPAGVVVFNDKLRPGVPDLVRRLRRLGVQRTVMLTGDRLANARSIAQEAGVDQVHADLLPADKVAVLQKLKAQYEPIVMVGDGINDAPALATATVGIAMGAHGTGVSAEAADIVLLVDDVTRVGDAVEVGQRTLRVARQSIYAGLGLSFALMVAAAFGLIPPAIGALAQEVVDVAVIVNALRAR
jgi:heavy metal translocating P-type ATPase